MKIVSRTRISKWLAVFLAAILAMPSFFATTNVYADTTAVTNLARGKPPAVTLISRDPSQTSKEAAITGRLTDGVFGDGDWSGHRTLYVDFFRNVGRHLFIDLGQVSTVKELRFRAMQDISAGIYYPQSVGFSISNDGGNTWSYLGSFTPDQAEQADAKHSVFKLGDLNYQANKVRISFPVDVWIFADELEIMGVPGVVDGAVPPPSGDIDPYQEYNAYPAPNSEQTRGAANDYLVYAGWHTNGTVRHDKTKDMLLPAVAYLDANRNIKDFMFDSFTFLPYATGSANRSFLNQTTGTGANASTKADWQEYIDFLFDSQYQLAALNEAVGEAKAALNREEYQAKVKIAIPNPSAKQSAFGEIDGVNLNFNADMAGKETAQANRVKATTWYIDQILARWDNSAYPNLRLDGFYWLDESVHTYLDALEEGVIKQTTSYVHNRGKLIYWIPYFQAPGFEKWKMLGFDYAVMQPNYAFTDSAPVTRPTDAALLAKRFGLGVEMELRNFRTDTDRQKYTQYLYQGTTAGYMSGSVRAWYMGTLTLQDAYASTNPIEHQTYDMTYLSIKGTYPKTPEQLAANLAYGKPAVVSLVSGDQAQTAKETAMIGRLTDNVYGNGDWSRFRAAYVDFFRNIARNVVIDLGQMSTVNEVSMRVMQDTAAGIGMPTNVYFSLSDDGGQTWRFIGSVPASQVVTVDAKHRLFRIGDLNYWADKVKISFDVAVWAFVDEIEVNGVKGIADGATQAPDLGYDDPYKEINAFPAPGSEQVRGTRNDLLVYAGWHTNGTVKEEKTVDKLLPGVAYLNWDGEVKDWMYDSFTFLPYATGSSGRSLVTASTAAASGTKADWEEYLNFLFDANNQLSALNEAVGQAKAALHQPDYQAKVKLAIPRPIPAQTSFGNVNGSEMNFNASSVGNEQALANRVEAVKWYIDEIMERWDPSRYPNLRFDGFYWLHESIEVLPNNTEEELLKQVNAYIHDKSKMIYWIPFYQSNGFYKWKQLGFDYAILQPNYAFTPGSPDSRPTDAALLAKRFGLGVEMEIHWNGLTVEADRQKYVRYLDQGVTAGYMNDAVRAWYMGTETLQQANASRVPTEREIYDKTYASIKGIYPDFPDHTAPVTIADATAGWHNTDQTVQLKATDDFIGSAATYIGVNTEPEFQGISVTITVEGRHAIRFYSVDHAGNQEVPKSAEIWIDKTAPVIGQPGTLSFSQAASIQLDVPVSDALSGVKDIVYTIDGNPVTKVIQPLSLPVGEHTLHVKVTDAAGNAAEIDFTLMVSLTIEELDEFISIGLANGQIDNEGVANSLLAQIESVQKKEEASLNKLENHVRAQAGKHITQHFADLLLADIAYLNSMTNN